jgi:hypothetical protein
MAGRPGLKVDALKKQGIPGLSGEATEVLQTLAEDGVSPISFSDASGGGYGSIMLPDESITRAFVELARIGFLTANGGIGLRRETPSACRRRSR